MHPVDIGYHLSLPGLLFSLVFFVVYWLPTFVAFLRNVKEKATVILLNLFGFLVIPWVVALVFAVVVAKVEPTPPAPPAA